MIILATLEEILQLDKNQSSIKKIDLFLSQKTKYSNEYMKAISYKANILYSLDKANDALKLLYEYVPTIQGMDNEGVIALTSEIIAITIDLNVFDQASKYIKIKQKYLPVSRQNEYIKDIVNLYLKKKDYENAKVALNEYLEDDITKDEEIYALEKLCGIYYDEKEYDKYLSNVVKLETYYQNILDLSKQQEISKNKIEISYERKNYIQVIIDGTNFFNDFDAKTNLKLIVAAYMIRSYINVSNYKKASIIESNYEEFVSSEYLTESLEFCNAAIELYNKTNTASSVIEYRRRIEELEEANNNEPIKKTKTKKKVIVEIPDVTITKVNEYDDKNISVNSLKTLNVDDNTPIQKQKIEYDIKNVKNVLVSNNFILLDKIFSSMLQIEDSVKFRECFRESCIALVKEYDIKEIYLLYFDSVYKGYHYKQERVYDKKPTMEYLEGSLGYQSYLTNEECFLDLSDKTYSKDIVKGETYEEDVYAVSIPLVDSIGDIGSITYISDTQFLNQELVYESIHLFQKAINYRLLDSIAKEKIRIEYQKMIFIQENMSSGIIENQGGYYHFSKIAQDILGVIEVLTERDYLMHLNSIDITRYKEALNELYNLKSTGLELTYSFNTNDKTIMIKERFYPLYTNGEIIIYSLIDDITKDNKQIEDLTKLAYYNPISNMQTLVKLNNDIIMNYDNKKSSLAVIDVIDSRLYKELYGLNFYNQVIKAVGLKLKKQFENHFDIELYHLEGTTYAVFFININDRRVIDSILKEALDKCQIEMNELNKRVKIKLNAGVYRLSKNSNLKNKTDMLYCAYDALIDAQNMDIDSNHIAHYDSKMAKERFYQNSLVTEISEAIDFKKMSLLYKQIIDLAETKVFGFYVSLNMDSYEIEEDKFNYVVKRKGLTVPLEKYLVQNAFSEQKMFYKEMKANLNLFIPISKETLEDKFIESLKTFSQFFKVDLKYFNFIVDSAYNTNLALNKDLGYNIASYDILDIYRGTIDYYIFDYHKVSIESIDEIQELCNKHNVKLLFFGMDEASDIDMARNNGYQYIFGNYYKKLIRMKDLLKNIKKSE